MNILLYITFGLMLILFFLRVPIWAAIILPCIPYFILNDIPLSVIPSILTAGQITSFILLAFPLFTLAGRLMNTGDITRRIFHFADVNVGWIRGGLGHTNVLASMLFAGMSGSAIADISGLGSIEIKGMIEKGYDLDFSTGITLASSVVGPIIPPSVPVIFYAVIAEESVEKLFLGGLVPGCIIGVSLMLWIFFTTKARNYALRKRPTIKEILLSWKDVILPLMTPAIIILGMTGGIFTPTEAASSAIVYAIILGLFVYKQLTIKTILHDLKETTLFCGGIYLIVAASMLLSFIITRERIADQLVSAVLASSMHPKLVIFILVLITLFLGCFIEVTALIILILPVFTPIVNGVGYSTVSFGVLFILSAVLGVLTPPFGLGLYIASGMTKLSFQRTVKSVSIYFIPLIAVIMLILLFPQIVSFFPDAVLK